MSDSKLRMLERAFRSDPGMGTARPYVRELRRVTPDVILEGKEAFEVKFRKCYTQEGEPERWALVEEANPHWGMQLGSTVQPNALRTDALQFLTIGGGRSRLRGEFIGVDGLEVSMLPRDFEDAIKYMHGGWLIGRFKFKKVSGGRRALVMVHDRED